MTHGLASSCLHDAVSDAFAYWESRRIVYNAVLVTVVLVYFAINWPYSRSAVSLEGSLFVFVLAVLANVCYCAAYLGDIFVQVSGFRHSWHKCRAGYESEVVGFLSNTDFSFSCD